MPTNKSRVTKFVDLKGVPPDLIGEVSEEVGEFLLTQVLEDIAKGISSVSGRKWKGLSPQYKDVKAKETSAVKANLELTGEMLDDLDWRLKNKRIEIGWFKDKDQTIKAFNHNTGDTLPKRQSIPRPSEKFRPGIRKEMDAIINEVLRDNEDG